MRYEVKVIWSDRHPDATVSAGTWDEDGEAVHLVVDVPTGWREHLVACAAQYHAEAVLRLFD